MNHTISTHTENAGDGHKVTIQHCEVNLENGTHVCDQFLGVNYPATYCGDHDVIFCLVIKTFMHGIVVDVLSETVKPLIKHLNDFAQSEEFKEATIREITRRR